MRLMHLRVRYARRPDVDPAAALAAAWAVAASARVAAPEWRPPCDITETSAAWTVHAEIGGLADEDLEVLLYEDSLVVQGVRPWRGAGQAARVHLAELRYGPFRFTLDLPADVEREGAQARYERGIVTVVLPKLGAVQGGQ
jgi:HSP20 family protein